jgi:hypothetical protein
VFDAPPNSLKDSNVNLEMKAMEEKKVTVCSFICNTSGGKRGMLELWDGD